VQAFKFLLNALEIRLGPTLGRKHAAMEQEVEHESRFLAALDPGDNACCCCCWCCVSSIAVSRCFSIPSISWSSC
jgi:hypothetical protein